MTDWELIFAWARLIVATLNLIIMPALMFMSLNSARKGEYANGAFYICWALMLKV